VEKTKMGNNWEIDIAVKGETSKKMIVPLLLFSFIENSFSYMNNKELETSWINLEFQSEPTEFTMKLIHGKNIEHSVSPANENAIANAVKRLDFFYPGNYELKTTVEPEIMMTSLKIVLEESVNENARLQDGQENGIYTLEQTTYATV
jgi:LytS/YehU family sensor histidine kinase